MSDNWHFDVLTLLVSLIAFIATVVLTRCVIYIAHRFNWVCFPTDDRWHKHPTALMGGIAIFAGSTFALIVWDIESFPWFVWSGATLMFLTGLIDDLKSIKPSFKFAIQTLAAVWLIGGGYLFAPNWSLWIAVPLTIVWVVGITNAFNLLDNMDGLSAGISAIAAGILAIFLSILPDSDNELAPLAILGASLGFLVFNSQPARIFMGDCGSLFLGYTIAALTLTQYNIGSAGVFFVVSIPITLMAVPIFDTTLVSVVRLLAGRSIAKGGRDHASHRMVLLGLSERKAVLVLYCVSLFLGLSGLILYSISTGFFLSSFLFFIVGLAVFGVYLGSLNVYKSGEKAPSCSEDRSLFRQNALLRLGFVHKRLLTSILTDFLLIVASFSVAYYLRFEGRITPSQANFLLKALPLVISVKLVVFYLLGLYRSIWRHVGTMDVLRIFVASTIGSVLCAILILGITESPPMSWVTFVFDWILTINSVAGVRLVFRGLKQYFASQRREGLRVLLYGAGDTGELSLREIRYNKELGLYPIGFVDDEPSKRATTVQGVPILGNFGELVQLVNKHKINGVLITSTKLDDGLKRKVQELCQREGIVCKEFRINFTPIDIAASVSVAPANSTDTADIESLNK